MELLVSRGYHSQALKLLRDERQWSQAEAQHGLDLFMERIDPDVNSKEASEMHDSDSLGGLTSTSERVEGARALNASAEPFVCHEAKIPKKKTLLVTSYSKYTRALIFQNFSTTPTDAASTAGTAELGTKNAGRRRRSARFPARR